MPAEYRGVAGPGLGRSLEEGPADGEEQYRGLADDLVDPVDRRPQGHHDQESRDDLHRRRGTPEDACPTPKGAHPMPAAALPRRPLRRGRTFVSPPQITARSRLSSRTFQHAQEGVSFNRAAIAAMLPCTSRRSKNCACRPARTAPAILRN